MSTKRRTFNKLLLASVGATLVPSLLAPAVLALGKARVVIIGGGAAGATAARKLAATDSGIDVVLIEPNRNYVTPFFTNRVLADLQPLDDFTFSYEKLAASDRIQVIHSKVIDGDPVKGSVRLEDGSTIAYDRLIVAPGTRLMTDPIKGYTAESTLIFPHAYQGSSADQWIRLHDQVHNMDDGGTIIITAPVRPYKCTPAPYERASLIAGYLQKHKPKSKLLVLDSKMEFPLMDAMLEVWEEKFGDLIEWVSADFGGTISAVNNDTRSILADGETFTPDVGNIIPGQRAGDIANTLDLTNDDGWCPINPRTFESTRQKNVHVLGDAIDGGDMPKSAAAASQQALSASTAIINVLTGSSTPIPPLANACYFLTEAGQGLVVSGRYRTDGEKIVGTEGYSSDPGETLDVRQYTAQEGDKWYRQVTQAMFG